MQPMHVSAGATIFRTGDPSSAVYVIQDGEVAITVNGGIEVARLHAGELFGESGVLEARVRAATATATTATTLLATDAETFFHAFGMNNDRALTLVKLLCSRLRNTTARAAQPGSAGPDSVAAATGSAAIHLLPDGEQMTGKYGMTPIDVFHLPFQVGNRYGGETLPIESNHCCCIPARGVADLAAPHFEILRRDGLVGVRDLGTSTGTCVNGTLITRASLNGFVALRQGDNEVIAGRPDSPFRFCVWFGRA
jgi:CRP/FNR family cyclic AMP-dependent transcriptional regulator